MRTRGVVWIGVLLLLSLCGTAGRSVADARRVTGPKSAEAPRSLEYRFSLGTPGLVGVEVRFQLGRTGEDALTGPVTWAGETGLDRAVTNVAAEGARLTMAAPGRWRLNGTPGGAVVVRYVLRQDWTGPRLESVRHRVVAGDGLAEWTGENGLLAPAMEPGTAVRVRFDFVQVPAGWSVLTSFGEGTEETAEVPWSAVENGLFAAGVMRVRTLPVAGGPVRLGVVGTWSFSDQELALKVHQVLREERRFWSGGADALQEPWYAVVLTPLAGVGGGGTAFTHAFALSLGEKERFGPEAEALLAHEAFHAWNPQALGPVGDRAGTSWFVEGVTTYYSEILLRRAGLVDRAMFLARVNRLLRDDRTILGKGAAVDALDAARAQARAPYLRGAMVALWLNGEIEREGRARGVSQSLDDVMRGLLAEGPAPLTNDRILAEVGRYVDAGTVMRMRSMVQGGSATVPLPDGASLGPCVFFGEESVWSFDLGFGEDQLRAGTTLTTVRTEGPAWRAGVRDGDVVAGWSLWQGDADHEALLELRGTRPGEVRRLHFWPRGQRVTVPVAAVPTVFHDMNCREGVGLVEARSAE